MLMDIWMVKGRLTHTASFLSFYSAYMIYSLNWDTSEVGKGFFKH